MSENLDLYLDLWKEEQSEVEIVMSSGKSYHGAITTYDDEIIQLKYHQKASTIILFMKHIATIVGK